MLKSVPPITEQDGRDGSNPPPTPVVTPLEVDEASIRRAVESSTDCIKILDLEGNLMYMNEGGMCTMEIDDFGPFRGTCWPDFWQGEEVAKVHSALEAARAGRIGHFHGYTATAKGNVRYWDVTVSPILNELGKPERLMAVSRDVTEAREAEAERNRLLAELEAERRKLWVLFERSPAAVAVLRRENLAYTFANRRYRELFTQGSDVVGKTLSEVLPEACEQGFEAILSGVMETGIPFSNPETPFTMKSSAGDELETFYVDLVYQPIEEADGTISGVFAHIVDVTEKVHSRQAVAERGELFRTVFQQAPDDAIVVMDADRIISAWNPAAERICGWTAEEAVGKHANLIFTPEDRAEEVAFEETMEASFDGKAPDERWHVRKGGERFWASGTMNALHGPEGAVRGYLKVFRDATAVREASQYLEDRVAERTQELEKAVHEAEGFNYSISHDLRTPLRAMAASCGILMEDLGPRLSEEDRSQLHRLKYNATRMGLLIDDLLQLSRLSRANVRRVPIDMTEMARSVATHAEGGSSFEIQEGMTAIGDPGLVRTVMENLVGNAFKFSRGKGTVRVGQDGQAFKISDEGVGFDPDHAKRIFMPFERLVQDHEFPGTGIGLANVKRIVERHGGQVWFESKPGMGATFFFTLGN